MQRDSHTGLRGSRPENSTVSSTEAWVTTKGQAAFLTLDVKMEETEHFGCLEHGQLRLLWVERLAIS